MMIYCPCGERQRDAAADDSDDQESEAYTAYAAYTAHTAAADRGACMDVSSSLHIGLILTKCVCVNMGLLCLNVGFAFHWGAVLFAVAQIVCSKFTFVGLLMKWIT